MPLPTLLAVERMRGDKGELCRIAMGKESRENEEYETDVAEYDDAMEAEQWSWCEGASDGEMIQTWRVATSK